MLLEVRDVAALELWEAVGDGRIDCVKSLLAAGVDPNARFDDLESVFSGVAEDWASEEKNAKPPLFNPDQTEQPALRRASTCGYLNKPKATHLMTALLQHGADPYTLYRQPLLKYRCVGLYPGQTRDEEVDDEASSLDQRGFARRGIIEKALRLERKQRHLEQGVYDPSLDEFIRDLKAVLMIVLSIWIFPSTIGCAVSFTHYLRAACSSSLYSTFWGTRWMSSDEIPRGIEAKNSKACTGPTFLSFFMSYGANLLAVDNYGKNALHLLFTYTDYAWTNLPPPIDTTLAHLIKNCPSLINQPNKAVLYPLHLAIWRMNSIILPERQSPASVYHFETAVDSLLAANANTAVRDGRGNTVLHYLTRSRLGERDRMGDKQRRFLREFLKDGVDPKARNAEGMTALEIFCAVSHDGFGDEEFFIRYFAIGQDVIDQFEKAGYNIKETNTKGQTLLHLVAGLTSPEFESWCAWPWFQLLRSKGLDPMAKDMEGKTPIDIAEDNDSINVWWQEERESMAA
ncbi:hypothetical protein N7449_007464 [Penicillium cf. viridicatum]|uniref:Ankyrin repeat protein n=1 Tax=Penicillium cf. viridicatum TaxID=2972119 RepID=A0A9W9JHD0_9EURO|nr:hypothetical protein N7449_007464 [Penicillium cf. viridicatum]